MKKLLCFFTLFSVLLLALQFPVSAETTGSLQDNLVPPDGNTKSVGEVQLKYNEYPQSNYKLDTWVDTNGDWMPWNWADGAGKQIYIALMEIINSIWNVNVLLANFSMKIVQEAFQLDFVSNVCDQIGAAIQNIAGFGPGGFMGKGLWPLLVTFVIGIVGAWATYVGMIKRESSRAWGGLISSIVIFVFALGFFSNASLILKGVNNWSSNLQSDILAVSANIVNPGSSYTEEEGIATIRNQMFDLMVKKPYLLMQYGTTQVEETRVNAILSLNPMTQSEDRQKKAEVEVTDKQNKMMSIDGVSQRAAYVPLLFLANGIIGIFLLIVSGSIILYQMIFLVLVLFAPVPLLMAIVPRWKQTAFDWVMKVLHAQLMKIAIALLLTILFGISSILYRATETSDLGFLGMLLLQIICFLGIWAKRKELFNMVSTATNSIQSSTGASLQSYRQKYQQAKNMARNVANKMNENNSGRIRNQPLAKRKPMAQSRIGVVNKDQLADRKKQFKERKDGLQEALGEEDQQALDPFISRTGAKNATADREQLMDRQTDGTIDPKENITSIDDLRRRRTGRNLARTPLVDRKSFNEINKEAAATVERENKHNAELSDRSESGRNIHSVSQHNHEDRINEEQRNQLKERRSLERSTEREDSQDITHRERFTNSSTERNSKDIVNRQSSHRENNQRTINNVTETNQRVTENITERENTATIHHVNREQATDKINQEDNNNVNREGGNSSEH